MSAKVTYTKSFALVESVILIVSLFLLIGCIGCSVLGRWMGEEIADGLGSMMLSLDIDLATANIFFDQPDKDNQDNYRKAYREIAKNKREYSSIKQVFKHLSKVKAKNINYFMLREKFYPSYSEIYDTVECDKEKISKLDTWGNEYYYQPIDKNIFIIGTMGPNKKWDVKLDEKFKDKLVYGNLNCFKDDIFVKIIYGKNRGVRPQD